MYMYDYVHTYIYIHTYNIYIHTYIHVGTITILGRGGPPDTGPYIHIYNYIYIHTLIIIYIYTHLHLYTYIYIYTLSLVEPFFLRLHLGPYISAFSLKKGFFEKKKVQQDSKHVTQYWLNKWIVIQCWFGGSLDVHPGWK